jgi:hypothetical protein
VECDGSGRSQHRHSRYGSRNLAPITAGRCPRLDDASAYIQARTGEADDEGEKPNGHDRSNRIEAALEEARARSRQARQQEHELDQGLAEAERAWQQQEQQEQFQQQQYANTLSYHEARGRCMERAEQLKRSNPTLHKTISDNLMLLESVLDRDQIQALEAALVWHTPAIWRLGQVLSDDNIGIDGTPMAMADKIDLIRQATPQQLWEGAVGGAANLRQEAYVQQRIYQDPIENSRKVTRTPPPIVPPKGTASVPKDMYRTAQKADASDYIKMRRAQMARDDED